MSTGTVVHLLNGVTASGAGDAHRPIGSNRTFQVSGISGDTVKIQVSNDNSNWVDLITTTADGGWTDDAPWRYVRANVTVYSAGTITVTVGV